MPDREKVIRAVDSCFDYWLDQHRYIHPLELETVRQRKAEALDLLKEQEWIPVTERLPKSMINRVIVYVQHEDLTGYIGFGHFEKFKGEGMWYDLENDCQFSKRGYTVTHWMETPIPPMKSR